MYKMIIADDERIIREGLTKLVDWNSLGFEIIKSLSDGEEVIEFLESEPVDVVLCDIMMPHFSGIDIARYVKESELTCKVVFISAYKEFELARQAIQYGVENYILKPSRMEEVIAIFQKIKKDLDNKTQDREERERINKQWEELQPLLREKFVHSLILGGQLTEPEDIKRRVKLLYPEVLPDSCICFSTTLKIVDYDNYLHNKWNHSAELFDDAIYNFFRISQENGYFHIVYKAKDILQVFVILKKDEGDVERALGNFIRQLEEIFQFKIQYEVEQLFDTIYQIAVSVGTKYHEPEPQVNSLQFHEQKKLIMSNVMGGNLGTAQKILKNIIRQYDATDRTQQIHIVDNILTDINKFLAENHETVYFALEPYINNQKLTDSSSEEEILEYCDSIFERISKLESGDIGYENGFVKQIQDYVTEHIYEDVSLEYLANEMYMTTTHLRRIFKKQTGETFLQYTTRKKMEKAAQLLSDPKYKIYQIGKMLGYSTPRYFSKLFLNFYGVYPQQYRKDVLRLGDCVDEIK